MALERSIGNEGFAVDDYLVANCFYHSKRTLVHNRYKMQKMPTKVASVLYEAIQQTILLLLADLHNS